jgi:hypothetical protein
MKTYFQKALAIAALIGIFALLHNAFQYRDSVTATGTVTQVGEKICLYYGSETSHFGCDRIAVKMSYKDGEIDREIDVTYRKPNRRPSLNLFVGAQVPIVYVSGRPWLTRFAANHVQGWAIAWLLSLLVFTAWLLWRGDRHPWVAWMNSRRNKEA